MAFLVISWTLRHLWIHLVLILPRHLCLSCHRLRQSLNWPLLPNGGRKITLLSTFLCRSLGLFPAVYFLPRTWWLERLFLFTRHLCVTMGLAATLTVPCFSTPCIPHPVNLAVYRNLSRNGVLDFPVFAPRISPLV